MPLVGVHDPVAGFEQDCTLGHIRCTKRACRAVRGHKRVDLLRALLGVHADRIDLPASQGSQQPLGVGESFRQEGVPGRNDSPTVKA